MTRDRAVTLAVLEAATATTAIAVYRLPAWPADVYGVRAVERLPSEAQKFEVFRPVVEAPAAAPAAGQGSLF